MPPQLPKEFHQLFTLTGVDFAPSLSVGEENVFINRQGKPDFELLRHKAMVWTVQSKSGVATIHMVERIISAGQISRQEHLQLTSTILSDHKISDEERRQINRIFDYVQIGRLKLVD